jgi:hypothetical protein
LLFPTRLCCFQQGFDVSWITFARMSKTLCIYVEQYNNNKDRHACACHFVPTRHVGS